MSDTKFKEAFDVFTEELRKDEGLYIAYQANIAMSFYDACQGAGYRFPELHKISNIAADNFLKLLLSKARQDLEENSNSQPTGNNSKPQGKITPSCETCLIRRSVCPHSSGSEGCRLIYKSA